MTVCTQAAALLCSPGPALYIKTRIIHCCSVIVYRRAVVVVVVVCIPFLCLVIIIIFNYYNFYSLLFSFFFFSIARNAQCCATFAHRATAVPV